MDNNGLKSQVKKSCGIFWKICNIVLVGFRFDSLLACCCQSWWRMILLNGNSEHLRRVFLSNPLSFCTLLILLLLLILILLLLLILLILIPIILVSICHHQHWDLSDDAWKAGSGHTQGKSNPTTGNRNSFQKLKENQDFSCLYKKPQTVVNPFYIFLFFLASEAFGT